MDFIMPCMMRTDGYVSSAMQRPYKTLNEALMLSKQAVQGEREDELFYDYLISTAPTHEEKDIITTIRDDERKHNKLFRQIYKAYTGDEISIPMDETFENPESYIDGIKKAKFGGVSAVERYRNIRAGLPNRYFRDVVFEILTDEIKHSIKYDYILSLNLERRISSSPISETREIPPKTSFTTQEAMDIARALGIDFNREKFDVEQFRMGLDTELEHGRRDPFTDVTGDNPILTGKIALAHLREFPDYYTRLAKFEAEAKAYWQSMRRGTSNSKKK